MHSFHMRFEWCVCFIVVVTPLFYAAIFSWEAFETWWDTPLPFWTAMAMDNVCQLFAVVDGNGQLVGSVPASWFQESEAHQPLEVFCQRLVNFDHC